MRFKYFNWSNIVKKCYREQISEIDLEWAEAIRNFENDAFFAPNIILNIAGFNATAKACKEQFVRRGYLANYQTRKSTGKVRMDVSHNVRLAEAMIVHRLMDDACVQKEMSYWTQEGRPKNRPANLAPIPNSLRGKITRPRSK